MHVLAPAAANEQITERPCNLRLEPPRRIFASILLHTLELHQCKCLRGKEHERTGGIIATCGSTPATIPLLQRRRCRPLCGLEPPRRIFASTLLHTLELHQCKCLRGMKYRDLGADYLFRMAGRHIPDFRSMT
jgi:hypothetical protein